MSPVLSGPLVKELKEQTELTVEAELRQVRGAALYSTHHST